LIDDTPSSSPNKYGFIEHRHDQAIFSLLCIKYKVLTVSAYEYWYPKKGSLQIIAPDWAALKEFPIHAKRDKGINSFFELVRLKVHKVCRILLSISKLFQ
jgi:hypothetical protein